MKKNGAFDLEDVFLSKNTASFSIMGMVKSKGRGPIRHLHGNNVHKLQGNFKDRAVLKNGRDAQLFF